MNLLDAVKSGRPFRRNPEGIWFKSLETHIKNRGTNYSFITAVLDDGNGGEGYPLGSEDILAEDWIIKEIEPVSCPICGKEMRYSTVLENNNEWYHTLSCSNTGVFCSLKYSIGRAYLTKEEFIKKWNTHIKMDGKL